jgi:spore coat-associated protein N
VERRSLAFYPSARTTHTDHRRSDRTQENTLVTTTSQDRPTRRTRRTVLVPLATVLVAGAVAVGSGATFTSTTNNTISSVTSGTLTHTNSKDGKAIFSLPANLKPGDTVNGTVTITNTGSLPAAFSLTELSSSNNFTGANLGLTITEAGKSTPVYSGTFGGLQDGAKTDLGTYASNEARVYTFSVKLDTNTTNTDQNKTAAATYQWDSVQFDGTTINQ